MTGKTYLLSTAYLPPAGWFKIMTQAEKVLIEKHETYAKQTYRNRCIILAANGTQTLSVPVLRGSLHRVPVDEVRIDYSRRWVPVHIRSITAAYSSSPFFSFYADELFSILDSGTGRLFEMNMMLLDYFMRLLKIPAEVGVTDSFKKPCHSPFDLRYSIIPKGSGEEEHNFPFPPYSQAFSDRYGFIPDLSIIDILFNLGSEAGNYLLDIGSMKKNPPRGGEDVSDSCPASGFRI